MKAFLKLLLIPLRFPGALFAGIYKYFKPKVKLFLSDLKYDRELARMYRRINRKRKEAIQLCTTQGRQFYVLPDPNKHGDFFCISSHDRDVLVKGGLEKYKNMDGVFLIKNAVFIARPGGNHEKRNFKAPTKEWLLQRS